MDASWGWFLVVSFPSIEFAGMFAATKAGYPGPVLRHWSVGEIRTKKHGVLRMVWWLCKDVYIYGDVDWYVHLALYIVHIYLYKYITFLYHTWILVLLVMSSCILGKQNHGDYKEAVKKESFLDPVIKLPTGIYWLKCRGFCCHCSSRCRQWKYKKLLWRIQVVEVFLELYSPWNLT